MQFHSYFKFPLTLLIWTIAIMSGVVSVLREVLAIYRQAPEPPSLTWAWLWIAFVASASLAWIIEHRERRLAESELARLKAELPKVVLTINDVSQRRSLTHLYWNADVFVLCGAVLEKPESLNVRYALEAILQGRTVVCTPINDMTSYCRRVKGANGGHTDYRIDALSSVLSISSKREGWLHFHLEGMPEKELQESVLRLSAITEQGMTVGYAEKAIAGLQLLGKGYTIVKQHYE